MAFNMFGSSYRQAFVRLPALNSSLEGNFRAFKNAIMTSVRSATSRKVDFSDRHPVVNHLTFCPCGRFKLQRRMQHYDDIVNYAKKHGDDLTTNDTCNVLFHGVGGALIEPMILDELFDGKIKNIRYFYLTPVRLIVQHGMTLLN